MRCLSTVTVSLDVECLDVTDAFGWPAELNTPVDVQCRCEYEEPDRSAGLNGGWVLDQVLGYEIFACDEALRYQPRRDGQWREISELTFNTVLSQPAPVDPVALALDPGLRSQTRRDVIERLIERRYLDDIGEMAPMFAERSGPDGPDPSDLYRERRDQRDRDAARAG